MNTQPSQALAQFVAAMQGRPLDNAVSRAASHALLDGLGVALAATTLGEGCDVFRQQALAQQASPRSRVWGSGQQSSASLAALANGALSHALDFEDTHDAALVHPNAAVIPAALAVAEERGNISGRELLTAISVGCEVVCRLGMALTVPLDRYGWYPPPILSTFGATAVAGFLYRLNAQQMLDAFSIALLQTSCSGEIKHNPESVIRAVRDAFPAHTGVMAAQLAQRGVKGFAKPFEGKAGFFALFARDGYDPQPIVTGLGEDFAITRLSFKQWPSCRGTHVFIDLLSQLLKEDAIQGGDIEQITAFGNGINRMLGEPADTKQQPRTSIDAKFSIPWCLAWTGVHGEPALPAFMPEALQDNTVLALAKRIHYRVDADYSDDGSGMLQGRIELQTRHGRCVEREGESAPGSPERPMGEPALVQKFVHCCEYFSGPLSGEEARQLADNILRLEQQPDLTTALFDFL